jgi:hypothetical protein
MLVSSNRAPGQPAANGLGPDTTRRSLTVYREPFSGQAPATADGDAPATSSTLATNDEPTTKHLERIAHLRDRLVRGEAGIVVLRDGLGRIRLRTDGVTVSHCRATPKVTLTERAD